MEQILANPVPQILDGVQHVPREGVQNLVGGSRWWMCQCHRSWRKSWSLFLVRSSATLVQQIVDVPVPQILEQSVEVIKVILQEQCQ